MKTKFVLLALFIAMTTTGFECINENLLVAVNVKGVSGTYAVSSGNGTFANDVTFTAAEYLDPDFTNIKDVRIYDIKVSTIGTYAGTISSQSAVTVNGQTILTLRGGTQWGYFNTPRSIITDPNIVPVSAGLARLITAIKNKEDVVIHGDGSISPAPFPSGLAVKIEVFGQVDAEV